MDPKRLTMMRNSFFCALIVLILNSFSVGFSPSPPTSSRPRVGTQLLTAQRRQRQWPHDESADKQSPLQTQVASAALVVATAVTVNFPALALAVAEADDYEYGKVDAPPLIPIIGGLAAIATALLPLLLRSGEEAFEEIRERDQDTFGTKDNQDVLRKK